ncbi:hypothetical protein [Thermodesulfovibrio hydrogeniphilus]
MIRRHYINMLKHDNIICYFRKHSPVAIEAASPIFKEKSGIAPIGISSLRVR